MDQSIRSDVLSDEQLERVLSNPLEIESLVQRKQVPVGVIQQLIDNRAGAILAKLITGNYGLDQREVAVRSIRSDYVQPLEVLLRTYYGFVTQHLRIAIESGSLVAAEWLLNKCVRPDDTTIQLAMSKYSVQIATMFYEAGVVFTFYNLLSTAEADNYNVYLYLRELGVRVDSKIALLAGPKILAHLCEHGPYHPLMSNRVLELISDVSVWESLYEKGITNYSNVSLVNAIERSDIKAVKWLYSIGLRIHPEHSLHAANSGSLKLLDWFAYMNFPIDPTLQTCQQTVRTWYEQYLSEKISQKMPERLSSLIEHKRPPVPTRRRSNTSFTSQTVDTIL